MKKKIYLLISMISYFAVSAQIIKNPAGNAVLFDGINDAVNANQQTTVYNNFTIDAWVHPTADITVWRQEQYSTVGSPFYGGINRYFIFPPYGGYFGNQDVMAGAGLTIGTNGICVFEHSNYYMPPILSWSGSLSGWNHIAIVYNNKQPSLFINAVKVATGLISAREKIFAGSAQFGGGAYGYYQGSADEIRIWNIPLNETQLKERMCKRIEPDDALFTNLVSYYNLDERSGDTVIDHSINKNNAVLVFGASRIKSEAGLNCVISFCSSSANSGSKGYIRHVFACHGFNNKTTFTGYGDYTRCSVTSAPGKLLGLSITPGYKTCSRSGVYINTYIDWNGDGDFTDPGETVFSPQNQTNVSTKFFVRVPASTTTGKKRMRVCVRSDKHAGPCDVFNYGEVEDYTVNIVAAKTSIRDALDTDFDQEENNYIVYPNPAYNYITIKHSSFDWTAFQQSTADVLLSDVNGKIVMRQKLINSVQKFDISKIASGIYFIRIITSDYSEVSKIVINR